MIGDHFLKRENEGLIHESWLKLLDQKEVIRVLITDTESWAPEDKKA